MKTKLNLKKLGAHPLGAIFPVMSDTEYNSLKKGMKANGFDKKHPIVLFEDQILEGNHRYTAAKETKTEPIFVDFEKLEFPGSPIEFVIQENLSRRNLTPSQLGQLGADLVEQMEKAELAAAEEAKAANLQAKPKKGKGEKVARAAKITGASKRQIAKARDLKKKDPKAAADVKSGKKSQHAASSEADTKKSAEDAKTDEFAKATARIDKICGIGFSLQAADKLKSSDILKLSGLDADEIRRVKPFIENKWSLKDALSYKSVELGKKHTIEQLIDRAISTGKNTFMLKLPDNWTVIAEQRAE